MYGAPTMSPRFAQGEGKAEPTPETRDRKRRPADCNGCYEETGWGVVAKLRGRGWGMGDEEMGAGREGAPGSGGRVRAC